MHTHPHTTQIQFHSPCRHPPARQPCHCTSTPLRLQEEAKKDPEQYDKFFKEFGTFLKEGACMDAINKVCLSAPLPGGAIGYRMLTSPQIVPLPHL